MRLRVTMTSGLGLRGEMSVLYCILMVFLDYCCRRHLTNLALPVPSHHEARFLGDVRFL